MEPGGSDTRKSLESELLFSIVKERYGHLLDDDQLDEARRATLGQAALARSLRAVPLANDVEPFSTFRPYRGE